jgi:N-acetyl-anhydromuramyl-L-alanine amidase AmpD
VKNLSFDQAYWQEATKRPDWYIEYVRLLTRARRELSKEPERLSELNKSIRSFFEEALADDRIMLAKSGPNQDIERQPINTIVIHHTSAKPGYSLAYMNAVHLLNIYASYYANPIYQDKNALKGTAIWSNHVKDNKQIFWAYHWLMRMDGTFERLLDDSQIGWHAGNWEINKRSIGICLDNNYDNQDPDDEVLKKLVAHIKKHYPQVEAGNIIGHKEAREGTTCPGTNFLDIWKSKLIYYVEELQ